MDEISGLSLVKILDGVTHSTILLKLKFIWNSVKLDIANSDLDTIIFRPEEMLVILDLRPSGYYKIQQGTLQQSLSKYYDLKRQTP